MYHSFFGPPTPGLKLSPRATLVKTSGLRPTAHQRRLALLFAVLPIALLSCKKDVTAPAIGSKLIFTIQPSNTMVDSAMIPAITVIAADDAGNPVATSTVEITLSLTADASGADLNGTAAVFATNGVATFPYLSLNRAGSGYTLTASATGLTSQTSSTFNVSAPTAGSFASVSIGGNSACGVTTAGAGYCWGNNSAGQLGNASTSNTTTPIKIAGGLTFGSVSVGSLQNFSCGLTTIGAAYCWGYNDYGQLGNATFTSSTSPVAVSGNLTFSSLSAGDGGQACAIAIGGAAYCWGYNGSGQLGVAAIAYSSSPVAVSGGLTFAAISAGENGQTCGVTTAGAGYCWGYNAEGELGVGTVIGVNAPTAVSGGLVFKSISPGFSSTCGITTTGAAYCWGDNTYGELGNGSNANSTIPVAVTGGLTFSAVSVGDAFACGVATSGAVYCWGYNAGGQLGAGTTTQSSAPVALFGGVNFASVSAGYASACAVTAGGAAYCWGNDASGQLGNASLATPLTPVLVVTPP
jgi:alpha-tubulin suppressor-like RCC1 family protein